MKIQVKQFAKKKIEALVKKDMQEWPPEFPIVKDTTPNITNSRLNNIP